MAISAEESARVGRAWSESLQGAPSAQMTALATGIDPKQIFCKDWPTAKEVLQALAAVLPQPGPIIINLVIAGGDAAQKELCPS